MWTEVYYNLVYSFWETRWSEVEEEFFKNNEHSLFSGVII